MLRLFKLRNEQTQHDTQLAARESFHVNCVILRRAVERERETLGELIF